MRRVMLLSSFFETRISFFLGTAKDHGGGPRETRVSFPEGFMKNRHSNLQKQENVMEQTDSRPSCAQIHKYARPKV